MFPIRSTYKVLADKAMDMDTVDQWVDWALEMMMAGYEGEQLAMLAGSMAPVNRFELDLLTDNVLREQGIDPSDHRKVIDGYLYYLAVETLDGKLPVGPTLAKFRRICLERDYDDELMPLYLLHFAREDLEEQGVQFYWDGATKDNIDDIAFTELRKWTTAFEASEAPGSGGRPAATQ